MITYSLERGNGAALYENLYKLIREDIQNGSLKEGTKLPSKRAFAQQLCVSVITVENAYAQLLTEGYITAKPRAGYYVSDIRALPERFAGLQEQRAVTDGKDDDLAQPGKVYFCDFSSNQTLPENFPFSVWAKVCREVLTEDRQQLMMNAPVGGVPQLRKAITGYLAQYRAMQVDPEQVIVGAGTEYLYGMLIQLLGFDRIYACENPGYRKISQVFHAYGVYYAAVGLDGKGISIDALEKSGADIVHVTPSHHFPTGITMPVSRRNELLKWSAGSAERFIIEDDYDSEFRMSGKPMPSLFSSDPLGRVIYMNTFTKSLASTIRISYMVLPKALLGRYRERLSFYSCPVPTFDQFTLARFITKGYFEKHINRMRNASRKKRNLLLEAIETSGLCRFADIAEEDAGLHFLMYMKHAQSSKEFADRLEENGIHINSLAHYFLECDLPPQVDERIRKSVEQTIYNEEEARRTLVMHYASVSMQKTQEAIRRIALAAEIE